MAVVGGPTEGGQVADRFGSDDMEDRGQDEVKETAGFDERVGMLSAKILGD